MSKTTYRNASGLPNDEQLTTARDQATLGRAIQERFPRYYRYFSTSQFTYRGSTMRNHNHLLGRVEGVDGIKTGYTNASGFNLVTSVRRNGRHIVAVVLGGTSAGARDARMRGLIEDKIADASTKRTVTAIAEANVPAEPMELRPAARKAPAPAPQPAARTTLASTESSPITLAELTEAAIAAAPTAPAAAPANTAPRAGSLDPIRPIAVKTVKVKLNTRTAALVAPTSAVKPAVDDSLPTQSLDIAEPVKAELPKAEPVKPAAPAVTAKSEPPASPSRNAHVASGWIIQIGAFGGESEAKQRLSAAQSKVKTLGRADPFTEAVTKGDKTFYRARFAGFEKDQAEAVCKQLKRNDFACLAIKN